MNDSTSLTHIDRLGASVSFACAIHCAITPFAVSILPLLGIGFLADERVERVVLAISVTLAAASVCWGVRIHKQRRILILFSAALFLIMTGRTVLEGLYEVLFVVSGAILFVCAHLFNHRLCHSCRVCR